ncbi:MAG: hypothetical protein AAF569_00305 [Pseudomonadota bacterium]
MITAASATSAPSGGAPASAPSSCDPVYYESLEQRSWMAGQREITQNQIYINKPDSVLEMTCFDESALVQGAEMATIFPRSNFRGVTPPSTWQAHVNASVVEPSAAFLDASYFHDAGGGTWDGLGAAYADSAPGCPPMMAVWQQARDENFIANQANEGFYTTRGYMEMEDPRIEPVAYEGPPVPWEEGILYGENIEDVYARPPVDRPGGYPHRDPLVRDAAEVRECLIDGAPNCPFTTGPNIIMTPAGGGNLGPETCYSNPGVPCRL